MEPLAGAPTGTQGHTGLHTHAHTRTEAQSHTHPGSGLFSPSMGAGQGGQRARGPGAPGRALLLNARTTLGLNRQRPAVSAQGGLVARPLWATGF